MLSAHIESGVYNTNYSSGNKNNTNLHWINWCSLLLSVTACNQTMLATHAG